VSKEALDAFLTFTPPANNQAFLNGIADKAQPTAEGPLWAGSWPEYDAIMGPAVQAVMNGEMTVEEFSKTICDQANKVFEK
jgi:multiple sugar transport system substrate-binding protein